MAKPLIPFRNSRYSKYLPLKYNSFCYVCALPMCVFFVSFLSLHNIQVIAFIKLNSSCHSAPMNLSDIVKDELFSPFVFLITVMNAYIES